MNIEGQRHMLVLIVEDEPIQRMEMVDLVDRAGFDVVECVNTDQAVELLEKRTDIRLMLSDIDIPGTITASSSPRGSESAGPIHLVLTSAGRPPH